MDKIPFIFAKLAALFKALKSKLKCTNSIMMPARENVMHEIGYFQGKYGLANVCLLHEEGTNITSNIHGLV